jgi:YgiT-type zinc finger domain-containing protein
MLDEEELPPALCARCNQRLSSMRVRTAIWRNDKLAVIEDIPALVCPGCSEQYYDDDVSEALRRLNEAGFPADEAERTVEVPIFSLEGRIRKRRPMPEDTYVD